MKWSLKLGSVRGIGVYVHWTFLLLIPFVAAIQYQPDLAHAEQFMRLLHGLVFVLAIFACVLLHEFGHALTAQRVGVGTRDITLLPIGGIARLERIPNNPRHEFYITIMGPMVNVVIAAVLLGAILLARVNPFDVEGLSGGNFFARLMWVNVILVVFNMLPAFPMDGGRILRSVLAMRLEYAQATEIAARVGQAMAILFGVLGLLAGNVLLMLIAVFVFLGAEAESQAAKMRSSFRGLNASDAMMTNVITLAPEDTLERAAQELLDGAQQEFPVLENDAVVGVLRRAELFKALREDGLGASVRSAMRTGCPHIAPDEALERIHERMQQAGCSALPVVQDGRLLGMVSLENVGELVMIRSALRDAEPPRHAKATAE
ncbi:MAG: site-2 protease family protein [Phycisphaerales bacterium]|nr:MAG: site-2 protease family protein [Phycisphaerales bacterium]